MNKNVSRNEEELAMNNEKLEELYELIKKTGYIQSFTMYRDMDYKSTKETNIILVLSTGPSYDGDMKVKLIFHRVGELKLGDIEGLRKILLDIIDVSDRQLEDIRYYVDEIENNTISCWCSDIEYEIV